MVMKSEYIRVNQNSSELIRVYQNIENKRARKPVNQFYGLSFIFPNIDLKSVYGANRRVRKGLNNPEPPRN